MTTFTDKHFRDLPVPNIGKATKVVSIDLSTAGTHDIATGSLLRIYNNTDSLVSLYVSSDSNTSKPPAPQLFITPGTFQDFGNDRGVTIHWDAGVGVIQITNF